MAHKSKKILSKFSGIPSWVFLILFIASAALSVYALRHNNQTMIKLRDAVYAADKNGGDVSGALNNLSGYVYGHMNTNLAGGDNSIKPPIQLKYTYERLQDAEQKRVNDINDSIYTQAQVYCQQQNSVDFSGRNRVPCVKDYVTTHGEHVKAIPDALYKFDFISPAWSPDLAGWSLVVAAILLMVYAASFTLDKLVNTRLKSI
jgi:hypothetical protein